MIIYLLLSLRSTSWSLIITIGQRLLNFVISQFLLKKISLEQFGLANIGLELLLQTSLFLPREGFRIALARVILLTDAAEVRDNKVDIKEKKQESANRPCTISLEEFINLAWIPVIIGIVLTLSSLFILINLAVDFIYAQLDPNVKLS